MLEKEIAIFGQRMGIEGLVLPPDAPIVFQVDGMGTLHIELTPEQYGEDAYQNALLIYLARPVPSYDTGTARRVLELSHFQHAHPFPLQGAVHGDYAVLLTRLAINDVTSATMENAIHFLAKHMAHASGENS
ncbi:MAG: type III secretion chaperone SycN [Pseudomonadota bacterium]